MDVFEFNFPITKLNIQTNPYHGQKPGTSGLRKKTSEAMENLYTENFIQSIFDIWTQEELAKKNVLVLGGDGRYFNDVVIKKAIRIAAAHGIDKVVIGEGGIMSTPAISLQIRTLNAKEDSGNCLGGFLLTASHNPGGPSNDWGIKFNGPNGGPAQEEVTNKIYENTLKINEIRTTNDFTDFVDLNLIGSFVFTNLDTSKKRFEVEIVSSTDLYVSYMKELFDFNILKKFVARKDFSFEFDGMSGVAGPYAMAIFMRELGIDINSLYNCKVLPNFGNMHPDPNLVYAARQVEKMQILNQNESHVPEFGAACDGDADRNMVLGKRFFVTPSDSVAILAANESSWIPKGKKQKGVARSMPTSGALDQVAKKKGMDLYVVPTGWKFFGNLMDDDRILLCGEESFGTSSAHIREKDGIWAVLAWLSTLANFNQDDTKPLITVENIVKSHWKEFGRNYYSRFDYETVETEGANKMMEHLETQFEGFMKEEEGNNAEIFEYLDPVDKSISKNQGIIFTTANGSRIIFRLSGTGSVGATIRVYFDSYVSDVTQQGMETSEALKGLIEKFHKLSEIKKFTGRDKPTVIT